MMERRERLMTSAGLKNINQLMSAQVEPKAGTGADEIHAKQTGNGVGRESGHH